MKIFTAVLLFFVHTALLYSQPEFIKDSLDIYVRNALKDWEIPGAAVCIIKDGKVVVSKGYGVRELGKNEKVDENTLFLIGSNTKAFTGTALALLDYEGIISLDDKVQKWLPDFTMKDEWVAKELNLTDIVTHRMGLETYQGDFMYWTSDLTADEVIEKFGKVTPLYGFRSKYGYTNAGYAIAGKIIEKATDTSWADFLSARMFSPLQMQRTVAFSKDFYTASNIAVPHTYVDRKISPIPFKNIDNLSPAASIGSSVNDLSHWVIAQLDSGRYNDRTVIPFKAIQKTRAPYTIREKSRHPFNKSHYALYGLGWGLTIYEGKEIVSHLGGVNGFFTSVTLLPEENLGIVVLTNSDQNNFYEALKWDIIDAYLKLPARNYSKYYSDTVSKQTAAAWKRLDELKDSSAMNLRPETELSNFTGKYVNEVYGYIDIAEENKKLIMNFEHHSGLKGILKSLGGNRFFCEYSDPAYGTAVIPFKISEGEVKSFTLSVDSFIDLTTYDFVKN